MANTIQLRRGSASAWTAANSVLAEGEIGIELDTNKFKIGSGTASWGDLEYAPYPPTAVFTAYEYIASASQTVFTGADENGITLEYDPSSVNVYVNGVLLQNVDYTASTGTSVVLSEPATLNDDIAIAAFGIVNFADTYTTTQADNLFLRQDTASATYLNKTEIPVTLGIACSDETTDLATASPVVTFRMPHAMTLTDVRASVNTAPVGSNLIIDINESGSSILSTKLSIDAGESTSTTAATAAVISDSALADDAEITIDIDQVGSTTAGAGLKVWLIGTRA